MLRFGYPITDVIQEDDRPVQYFERARLEYHAEIPHPAGRVLLGLLVREVTADTTFPVGPLAHGRLFPTTGYTVFGKFLQYWETWGGLPMFGLPMSESYVDVLPDGTQRAVQWFERARLEYHPEVLHPFYDDRRQANDTTMLALYEIQLGHLGRDIAEMHGYDVAPTPRIAGVPDRSPGLWSQRIEVDLSEQQLLAYEGDLLVLQSGVSTGQDDFETVTGRFTVYAKLLYDDMTGQAQGEEYDVRKVPYVLYFHRGYAIHGTYWHDQFGTGIRRSHGCINLPLDRAEWLWQWAQPAWDWKRAQHATTYQSLTPDTEAEADLQPAEGLAIFQRGTPVLVRR